MKDIPFNGDSRETLDRVHVKYVLPKVVFMSKTVTTFVQKVGLIWLKGVFYFSYLGHKCNYWLKIVNHWDKRDNGVTCTCTGKEIKSAWFKISLNGDKRSNTLTCKLLLKLTFLKLKVGSISVGGFQIHFSP